jgi:hypothetical protein
MSFVPSVRTRKYVAGMAVSAALALALAACTSSSVGGTGSLANGAPSAGTSASAPGAGASSTPAAPTTHPTTAAPTSHAYPSDYAGAILAAWKAHDTAYLTLLTSASTANQLYGFGDINQVWTRLAGSGAAGSTFWQCYNAAGDWIVFQTNNVSTGAHTWHAGHVSTWDQMTFPDDPNQYVKHFVDAWLNGNVARMKLLSSATVTAQFTSKSSKPDFSYTVAAAPGGGAAGSQYIEAKEADPAFDVTLQLISQFLGHEHAIAACQSGC